MSQQFTEIDEQFYKDIEITVATNTHTETAKRLSQARIEILNLCEELLELDPFNDSVIDFIFGRSDRLIMVPLIYSDNGKNYPNLNNII